MSLGSSGKVGGRNATDKSVAARVTRVRFGAHFEIAYFQNTTVGILSITFFESAFFMAKNTVGRNHSYLFRPNSFRSGSDAALISVKKDIKINLDAVDLISRF
jgi:hypothetical protein